MVAARGRWLTTLAVLSFTRILHATETTAPETTAPETTAPAESAPSPAPPASAQGTAALDSAPESRGPASEREREAEAHRLRALRFWDLRSFPAAREELLAAYELSPRPLFLYNLAVTSMALADSAGAYDYFESYLRKGGSSVPPQRRAMVERQLQDLAQHVTTLHVSADVVGAQVLLNDRLVATTPVARPLRVNVGYHSLTVRRAKDSHETRRVQAYGGQTLQLRFALLEREQREAAETKRKHWLIAGWTTTAVLGTGAALAGWKALSAHDDYQAALGEIDTSREALDELDAKALRWSVTADVLAVSALAAGACSLYLTLKPLPPQAARSDASANGNLRQLKIGISARSAYITGAF